MLASALPNNSSSPRATHPCRAHPRTRARRAAATPRDNDRPLVEDIRLLGRILGDVIREQEGVDAFELVERMRKLSVAFRRDADARGRPRAQDRLLKNLSATRR